jgi:hypothetical protein
VFDPRDSPDRIEVERDRVPDALTFDNGLATALAERAAHCEDGLKRASGRADIGFPARRARAEVGDRCDGLLRYARTAVSDGDSTFIDRDQDLRRDARFLTGVEAVFGKLFGDDERPTLDGMSGRLGEFGG